MTALEVVASTVDVGVDSTVVDLATSSTVVALDVVDGNVNPIIGASTIDLEIATVVPTMETTSTVVDLGVSTTVVDVEIGMRGPTGPTGPAGPPGFSDSVTVVRAAHAALSGHRVVVTRSDGELEYADNTDITHLYRQPGLTTNAATVGASVDVLMFGPITEPSWSWTPDLPLYLGVNGTLTQLAPTAAAGALFLTQIGVAESATTVFIDPQLPIVLH